MAKTQHVCLNEVVGYFDELEDPRSSINQKHPLVSVVVIAMMAVLAGAGGPTAIARWANFKAEFLVKVLDLPNGIPRKDVFRRVLCLLQTSPCGPTSARTWPRSHNDLGFLLFTTGRLREAEEAYAAALTLRKQAAAELPNQPEVRNDLAGTCVNLAILHLGQGNFKAAKAYLDEAVPHHESSLTAKPRHPVYRQFYRNNRGCFNSTSVIVAIQKPCRSDRDPRVNGVAAVADHGVAAARPRRRCCFASARSVPSTTSAPCRGRAGLLARQAAPHSALLTDRTQILAQTAGRQLRFMASTASITGWPRSQPATMPLTSQLCHEYREGEHGGRAGL